MMNLLPELVMEVMIELLVSVETAVVLDFRFHGESSLLRWICTSFGSWSSKEWSKETWWMGSTVSTWTSQPNSPRYFAILRARWTPPPPMGGKRYAIIRTFLCAVMRSTSLYVIWLLDSDQGC